jgi:hypothetical protein
LFNRLKQVRRIATRYGKTAKSGRSLLPFGTVRIWRPHSVNRALVARSDAIDCKARWIGDNSTRGAVWPSR